MQKEILKFIKSLFIFGIVAILGYVVLVCIWGEFLPEQWRKNLNYKTGSGGNVYSRLEEAKTYGNTDVVFLGSSHTYRGFDPRIFEKHGYRAFNLGSSSQTPVQTLVLVNRYIDQLDPEVIIYEVYPGSFTGDGVESALDLIANDKNDLESIKMALKTKHIKVFNTLIYGFFRDLTGLNKGFKDTVNAGNDRYISGGFVESDVKYYKNAAQPEKLLEFKDMQFKSFEKVCNEIKSRGIRLVLVEAPVGKEFYKAYKNKDVFDKKMESLGDYYNFNEIMEVDDSLHFYDAHHLNQIGVELFNEKLIDLILGPESEKE
jgi:hypothetical protein